MRNKAVVPKLRPMYIGALKPAAYAQAVILQASPKDTHAIAV